MTTLGEVHGLRAIQTGPFGTQLKADEYNSTGNGAPVVSVGEIREGFIRIKPDTPRVGPEVQTRLGHFMLDERDVVVSRKGAVDRSAWISKSYGPLFLGSDAIAVRFDDPDTARFYSYVLRERSVRGWLVRHAPGTTMLSMNGAVLGAVPVPPSNGLRMASIVEVLGALDDKIAANHRLVDSLDDLIRSCVASRLVKPIQLWEALSFVFGEAFKGDSFSAPGIGRPLVRIRDLKSQKCQVWTTERRERECEVRPGDILVGMDAEFRPTRWSGPEGVLNQRVLSASSDTYGPAIALEMLVAPLRRIERSKAGTTVIHLNKSDLLAEEVLAPVGLEVPALRALVDPMWERAVAAEQESVRLAATRDELLPLLMSGKITVKDAEKTVEEVV
ncbi:type I restriction-modification system, specificity subunit S [Brachybacterium sp. SW0106-09]|uniref:restriction endonuclease subunit S n=1 Tax=Brachybacterium sp. SW0106-09 TaxID=1704590 RepID=UPI0006C12CD7|nr:hypothetical protein [Brachybacterium sp. SW0106-09]GAP80155.1 type I restriction-modification system, specificity subunit S [Brachybacterium sp. SW0106-09]